MQRPRATVACRARRRRGQRVYTLPGGAGTGGWAVGQAFSGSSVGMWLAHVGFVFNAVPIIRRIFFFQAVHL